MMLFSLYTICQLYFLRYKFREPPLVFKFAEFKFRQERKRRRMHFQRSLSPTEIENTTPNTVGLVVVDFPAKLATCKDSDMHEEFKHKANFLHKIGLTPTLPENKKSRHLRLCFSLSFRALS